jgi:Fe-S oxidoreductase
MNPWLMLSILVLLWGAFGLIAVQRLRLLLTGHATWESRFTELGKRLSAVWTYALFQKKMRYYFWAGIGHQLIFVGFAVLLLRTLLLWGRGFDPGFNLWILGPEGVFGLALGQIYEFAKDIVALLVLAGVGIFVYYRVISPQKRMSLSGEGLLILGIIATMMLADIMYDGASLVLRERVPELCRSAADGVCASARTITAPLGPSEGEIAWHVYPAPAGSFAAMLLSGLGAPVLIALAHAGFWTHSTLVLVFLNLLPRSKHFHVITAIPNVAFGDLTSPGRLRPLAKDTESLMAEVEKASENPDANAARIGYARIEHFTWKDYLDFYTCTECGRCSDNCPAFTTGKLLSPKQLTLDLRNHLYAKGVDGEKARSGADKAASDGATDAAAETKTEATSPAVDLVPTVIHPDVLWACTTCRACEEQCPVNITYVDKIVQMRRHLVMIRGEFPAELNKPFEGIETNGNPWNLARVDRARWTEGLDVPRIADKPDAKVLYWVGCAASYDDRAKKIARATAELLLLAGVDFAILAEEENCTGDPARRAGNEYLFTMLASQNVETLQRYRAQGGVQTIVTTCPHCFNTLKNEYPDFGAHFEVVHHSDFLLGLVAEGRLSPKNSVTGRVTYHDSCYLGRYNGGYESPREILRRIPGLELVEAEPFTKKKGLCCGAGGAQMFMEEQNSDRVNIKRTKQLLATEPKIVASACPFCMTMLTDGLKAEAKETEVKNLDLVEVLALACAKPASTPSVEAQASAEA